MVSGLKESGRTELKAKLAPILAQRWLPNPGPQTDAYLSKADLLLYGGAAGGGKSALLVGLALTAQKRSVIFRRAFVDLRGLEDQLIETVGTRDGYNGADKVWRRPAVRSGEGSRFGGGAELIEFGALEKPGAEQSWQGRPHDFIGFDEGAQLSAAKVSFVLGWLRSTAEKQRCRAVIASNPPIGGEGAWLSQWFAPWLDPLFADPAAPGELRWAIVIADETRWVDGPEPVEVNGETYTPQSRTFIPARLDDNPYLKGTGYRERLQNLPEPLRSQLLKGDFLAGREDHEWQLIPSAWVDAANDRWVRSDKHKRRPMLALACDPAMGGADATAFARLHAECWFDQIIRRKDLNDPAQHATVILNLRKDEADVSADCTGGWGSGIRSSLQNHNGVACAAIVFGSGSDARTKDKTRGFRNLRAEMWWRFREALDPDSGEDVHLPPDVRLKAELTTPRWKPEGDFIKVEAKDDVKKRVGGSTDSGDAVIMAWHRRASAQKREERKERAERLQRRAHAAMPKSSGWMGR